MEEKMATNYVCTFCSKGEVKLWRPKEASAPLICAACAEKKQARLKYPEIKWEKKGSAYIGTHTGRERPLKKWQVDEEGFVPSYKGPGPRGMQSCLTNELIIDLEVDGKFIQTSMIPAVIADDGTLYVSIPKYKMKHWTNLPTR